MLTIIKTFLTGKFGGIAIIGAVAIVSVLLASLGTMSLLYKVETKKNTELTTSNATLFAQKQQLQINIDGLNDQIKKEKELFDLYKQEQQKAFDDYTKRQQSLQAQKTNKEKKAAVTKNPKAYEIEVKKAIDDYQNRMNCITGNKVACSQL